MPTHRLVFLGLGGLALLVFGAYGLVVGPQQQAPSPQALHDATASVRDARKIADDQFEMEIRLHGMEPGRAGLHLLRPVEDPLWTSDYSPFQPHADYRWYGVPVRYSDREYQRRIPLSIAPGFLRPLNAHTSHRRVVANSIGNAAKVAAGDGTYRVELTVTPQGVAALQALLLPKATFATTSEYSDWFRVVHQVGATETPMALVVVSDHKVYVPFVVQSALASASSGGLTVVVADRLPESEAQTVAYRLNQR